jgi:hypothetical protein
LSKEIVGQIAGLIVILSVIPYSLRVYQRKITPNIISWSLWTLLGLALLLTYRDSGAKSNIWPVFFSFLNTLLISTIAIVRQNQQVLFKISKFDSTCFILGLISLIMWIFVRNSRNLVQYALYIVVLTESLACIPTIRFLWKSPWNDRPFAWSLFVIASAMNFYAIPEYTLANVIVPIYMVVSSAIITLPLCLYRISNQIPLKEWI